MLGRIANREDPDQTVSEEAVWSGSALSLLAFRQATSVLILEHSNTSLLPKRLR